MRETNVIGLCHTWSSKTVKMLVGKKDGERFFNIAEKIVVFGQKMFLYF